MPLKLVDPRKGRSPNYSIRGTYLGVSIDRTTGTADRGRARQALKQLKEEIERGAFQPRRQLTFAAAALAYTRAGGEKRYLWPLSDYFGETLIADIDQAAIDEAAVMLFPDASAATRNRQVYTPISAIMRHNKVGFELRRPKGAQGEVRVDWLWPEQASKLFDAAGFFDAEFRIFLICLTYCGPRVGEILKPFKTDHLRLQESFAFIGKTKNGDPRPVHLPPIVVAELANHPRGLDRPGEPVFRFRRGGNLYSLMAAARSRASLPVHVTFHTLRHTWATWMRRYGGLDTRGLVDTGLWRDPKSAARYEHVVVSEEARRADLLPDVTVRKRLAN